MALRTLTILILLVVLLPGCGGRDGTNDLTRTSVRPATGDDVDAKTGSARTAPIADRSSTLPDAPGLDQSFLLTYSDVISKVDPTKDQGWNSEAFNEAAGKQLKLLGKLLADPKQQTPEHLEELASAEFQCATLRPASSEVFRDGSLIVRRRSTQDDVESTEAADYRGTDGLNQALIELASAFDPGHKEEVHSKFKVIRVELGQDTAETEAYFEASGPSGNGIVQLNAVWRCRWSINADRKAPQLTGISVSDYEEIHPVGQGRRLFADCTEAVLGSAAAYRDQLAYGANYWYGNLDVAFGIRQGNQGLALGDINGDGRDDVYVCQPAGLPNRLFVHQPDGTLREVTAQAGVDWLDLSRSALLVDLDNDGDQDLVVVLKWSLLVHENDGQGRFTVKTIIETKFNLMSLCAADYDNDGLLDLYACGYSPGPEAAPTDIFANPVPYHDANNGARNFLLRNESGLNFKDVTEEVGLDQNNRRFSFAAAWEDYDNDGDLDIYVANDFGRNNLYRNDQGRFTDVAAQAQVEDIAAGMSVSWADYDRDGLMDVYVSNMFSSAGNRIAYQRRFKSGADDETRDQLRRHARGNTLFRNLGNGQFEDVSVSEGVTMGRWAWGSLLTDINNDGWDDVYVTNGFFTSEDTGDL